MGLKLSNTLSSVIILSYFALAVITPLLFSTQNSELFEVPKMFFVYMLAVIIGTSTGINAILEKKNSLPLNLVTISLLVYLAIQIVSTLTSIDKFTSVFGYSTRLNGGLLSQLAYFLIFVCAVVNLTSENAKKLLVAIVLSAFAVSLWGIPSHFGFDPNCLVLTGDISATCWQKDFDPTLRIFSTLGQPNWLASYLILTIPLSIALGLIKKGSLRYFFFFISAVLTLALIFTNSRAGFAGLIVSMLIFTSLFGLKKLTKNSRVLIPAIILTVLVLAFTAKPMISRITEALNPNVQTGGGTESSQIRLIVWKGAVDIIKHNPLLGTGPETFAYSYYMYRPEQHNKTTEWNFFYNKAHNEFLNIAANVGIPGLLSYIAFLTLTIAILIKIGKTQKDIETSTLSKAVVASIVGYQLSIFFGFSTVASQLVMFLQIACIMVISGKTGNVNVNFKFLKKPTQLASLFIIGSVGLYLAFFVVRLFLADIFITRAKNSSSTNSLLMFANAIDTTPTKNPAYLADTAFNYAAYAISLEDLELSDNLAQQAANFAQTSQDISPQNILTARKLASTYILLLEINPIYEQKATELGNIIVDLAPTDPQSYLSLAKVQVATDKNEEAKTSLQKALILKPDYIEAQELLDQLTNES